MKEIPLTRGKVAIVDDEDYERLNVHKWCVMRGGAAWYACRGTYTPGRGSHTLLMHRVILSAPRGVQVDHKNSDGLNNTRGNLRLATISQNGLNARIRKDNTTGYKGIWQSGLRWAARIRCQGKRMHLGVFSSPEAAARAYDKKALELFGEFARLNFPEGQATEKISGDQSPA